MKRKHYKSSKILVLILFFNIGLYSQDIVTFKSGDSISCRITKITDDTLFLQKTVYKNIVDTYITFKKVKDFRFHLIESIKNENDTSMVYSIILNDGSALKGKVLEYDKTSLKFDENNLGKLTIEAISVKNFKKEIIIYLVNLSDGNKLYGKILERRLTEIDFETETFRKVTVSISNIKNMQVVTEGKIKKGEYWFSNPNNTRYFYAPSAFNLKKGEGYYQNVYAFLNSANYGVSNHFSIGGGFMIPGIFPFAVYVTPKVNFKITEKLYTGVGVLAGFIRDQSTFGIAYGVTTFGTNEHNITLGAGYCFFNDEFIDRPIITLNAMTRVSKKIALVTENWSIPVSHYDFHNYQFEQKKEYDTYFSYGMRIMSEKITFDIAFVNSKEISKIFPVGIPYVDFVYKF